MTEITLVKADGSLLPLNSKEPLRQVKSAVMKEERMGEDTLTLVVEATLPIDFTVGDTLQALGKTYYLNTLPGVQRSARRHLTYTVVLESAKYDLSKTILVNEFAGGKETVNETEFSYTGEFDQLMDLAVINLNRTQGADSWQWRKVDTGADPDFDPQYQECKTLTFSCENVLSALNTICTEWGVEYRIETVDGRRTISVGQIGRQVYEYRFAYGKGRGLYSLTRSNASESSAPTRLYAYGSSQNLGTAYRERRRRLALPLEHPSPLIREGLYVQDDALVERFGLIEGAVIFDQVYPSREGTVSSVDPQDELKFTDLEMFDLNETDEQGDSKYLLGTSSPVVHFNTGNLGGYEFSIAGYNSTTKTFTLVPFTDENEYRYPSADDAAFRIAPGDRYVLLGIALPETYVAQAEERLAEKALEKYTRLAQGRYAYSLEIDPFFMKEYFPNARFAPAFSAGDYLYIEDADLVDGTDATTGQAGTAAVKISSVSIDLYQPYHYTVELSESAAASVITQIVRSEKEIEKIVQINDLADPARARRNLRTTAQLLEMTFDTDGYFRDGRIRPETIETKMIAVGALSQQFLLEGVVFSPNWNADPSQIAFSQGVLTHLGLDREQIRRWTLLPGQVNGLEDQTAYYLYARCEKDGASGTIVLDTQALRYDQQEGFYYFSIGILSRVEEGFRRICLTYGSSTINGREITTGRIASSDGATYFDLDRGQIGGRIVFSDHSSTEAGETILEGGMLNTRLIDTDRLVARHIEASDGHIADFTIQGKEIVGRDGTIVLQNDILSSLSALLSGEEDTYSIPIGSGATASAEKTSDGQTNTLTVDTITATTDVPLSDYTTHAGVLRFAVDFQVDTQLPEMGILTGESPTATCEVLQVESSGQETVIDRFSLLEGRNNHLTFINSPASYRIRTSYGATFTVDWLERPEGETQFPVLEVTASVSIVGYEGAENISYQANTPSTRIGTDGLFSFWSPQQYLYFSKDEGFSLRSGITLTSPNGEYSLTVNDQGISIKGEAGTDASNNTVSFTMAGTRVNISTGEKLSVAFGKIARWLADLKTVAFTGKYSDLDGRPASLPANGGNADTVDGKHASDFLPTSAKGAASGVASLDENGRIPAAQLPSYVDDVLEYATMSAFPAQGEAGKIYVATQTNLTYRWSGTGYVEISPSLALGGTSSTAFPGDRGVTLETKVSGILDGGLKVAKAASADTALEANHAASADTATQATNADYANSATNAEYAVHAQEADEAASADTALEANHAASADTASALLRPDNGKVEALWKDVEETLVELYAGEDKTVCVAEAGHATSADTATRATQDGNGANIAQSYLRTMGNASNTTANFNPDDESSALDPVSGGTLWSTFGRIVRRLRDIVSGAVPVSKATSADAATRATQDGDGNNISSTYLKRSGGQMEGMLSLRMYSGADPGGELSFFGNNEKDSNGALIYGITSFGSSAPVSIRGTWIQSYLGLHFVGKGKTLTINGDGVAAEKFIGNLQGNATNDGNGNKIADTYLKRIGGVMTGTLVQKKSNCSIHTDVASYRMPDNHTGWVRIDFGLLGAELLGVIDLIVYGKGGISIDFSGYTYVSSSNPTANNWYAPKYGIRGSLDAPIPIVRFAKDNTTGRRYIMIGGDSFAWGPYGFISLSKIVLGSLGNTTGDLSVSIEAVSGNYADLGLTNASVSNPSVNVEVERARKDGNGKDIPSTYATKEELPDVYVDTVPTNPKDGDILITTTD